MWYFDAWAVLDGLAFVSERWKDEINSESTAFLSVPDLEAVPVGRISTALRATRAGFQEGFLDADLQEIGFETLEQVRETVRRGFLGSGLGPGAPEPPEEPAPEGDEPPPAFPESTPFDGGEYYEGRLSDLGWQGSAAWSDFSGLCYAYPRHALLGTLESEAAVASLYAYLRAFAEATVVEYASRNRRTLHHTGQMGGLLRWVEFLISLGLWEHPGEFDDFLASGGIHGATRDILQEAVSFLPYSLAAWSERASPQAIESLLFRLPCPLRRHWSQNIHRLSDKLLLPLVDRQYFASNPELPEFIPLLLCAMAIVADQPLVHWRVPGRHNFDRRRLIARAFRWISHELPGVELPWQAESLLSDYAWRRLDGLPPGEPLIATA